MKYPITITAHLEVIEGDLVRFKKYVSILHEPSGATFEPTEPPEKIQWFFCAGEDLSRKHIMDEFSVTELPGDPATLVLTQRFGPDGRVAEDKVYCDDVGSKSVDLKWGCWSTCEGHWEDYAPGVYAEIKSLKPGEEMTIHSGPRKEIRFLNVTIKHLFPSMWVATGVVLGEWDSPSELMDTVGVLDDSYQEAHEFLEQAGGDYEKANELAIQAGYNGITNCDLFVECLPFSRSAYAPGVELEINVKANSFAKLMRRIDKCEDALIKDSEEEWRLFENMFSRRR